jgi:hypothetical protein
VIERIWEFRSRLRQKLCRHNALPVYEEVRTAHFNKVYWSAFYTCRFCGDVTSVEASFSGDVYRIGEQVEEEIARLGEVKA